MRTRQRNSVRKPENPPAVVPESVLPSDSLLVEKPVSIVAQKRGRPSKARRDVLTATAETTPGPSPGDVALKNLEMEEVQIAPVIPRRRGRPPRKVQLKRNDSLEKNSSPLPANSAEKKLSETSIGDALNGPRRGRSRNRSEIPASITDSLDQIADAVIENKSTNSVNHMSEEQGLRRSTRKRTRLELRHDCSSTSQPLQLTEPVRLPAERSRRQTSITKRRGRKRIRLESTTVPRDIPSPPVSEPSSVKTSDDEEKPKKVPNRRKAGRRPKHSMSPGPKSSTFQLHPADTFALAADENLGILPEFTRLRKDQIRALEKYSNKFPELEINCKAKADEEPNICTRCDNQPAGMSHFYVYHNGLLAAEQESFEFNERRKRWSFTVNIKKCQLRCQVPTCRKLLNSVTAVIYHEKICFADGIEKVACPQCSWPVWPALLKKHIQGHDKLKVEKSRWSDKTVNSLEAGSSKSGKDAGLKKRRDSEEMPGSSESGRKKRRSAVTARKKFQSTEDDPDDLNSDRDESSKYEPSKSDQSASDNSDYDDDEATASEDEEADDADGTSTSCTQSDGNPSRRLGPLQRFLFPRLTALWERSLDVLGYAKCQMENCSHMASNLPDIITHYNGCRKKEQDSHRLFRCRVKAPTCKTRVATLAKLIHHYVSKHKMSVKEARAMSLETAALSKTPATAAATDWVPSPAEIDALHLFG